MSRENQRLTDISQAERDDFYSLDYGGCSCFISPSCNFCVHPGNPRNQDEFDECWEPEGFAERVAFQLENVRLAIHAAIDRLKGGAA